MRDIRKGVIAEMIWRAKTGRSRPRSASVDSLFCEHMCILWYILV
jgi:hypothetical protein